MEAGESPDKLHVGCGDKKLEGYINVDGSASKAVDLIFDMTKEKWPFNDDSFVEIVGIHCFEHVPWNKQLHLLKEFYRMAKSGCILKLEVPDMKQVARAILDGTADSDEVFDETRNQESWKNRILRELCGGGRGPLDFHKGMLWDERLVELLNGSGWGVVSLHVPHCKDRTDRALKVTARKR